jgi:hypothetical protein
MRVPVCMIQHGQALERGQGAREGEQESMDRCVRWGERRGKTRFIVVTDACI